MHKVPISTFLPTLIIFCSLDTGHSNESEVISHFGLMCMFLVVNNVDHLLCLLAICISSFKNCLFNSFALFKIGLFLLLLSCRSSLYILDLNLLSAILFANTGGGEKVGLQL